MCLPALDLSGTGPPLSLAEVDRAILYFYPGAQWAPESGYDSRALDEVQHRAFADHWEDLLALRCNAFGISTQSADEQDVTAAALGIGHPLLCDSDLRLARELGLPRFVVDGANWYSRLTLIVNEGVIAHVIYPVTSAIRSPAQAIAWMRRARWA
jgi:peroxiredoxin